MPDRAKLRADLLAVRDRCRAGYCVNDYDWHALIDAIDELAAQLGWPKVTTTPPEPDPWDEREEREAIEHEPPSRYYLIRHPKV